VKKVGVVLDREMVRTPLGWLAGGVRATSVYDALGPVWVE
jgi:hypothetical protein